MVKDKWHAPFTIIAAFGVAYWFNHLIAAPDYYYSLAGVILGIFYLYIGFQAARQKNNYQMLFYNLAGGATTLLGLLSFPIAYFSLEFNSQITLAYCVISLVLFSYAIVYSLEWQKNKIEDMLSLRRFFELAFASTLTIPAVFATWIDPHQSLNALLAIVLGISSIALSGFIRLYFLRIAGYISFISGFLIILFYALREIKALWPTTLLIVGFILIGLAYFGSHRDYRKGFRTLLAMPNNSLYGLGINPEPQSQTASLSQSHTNHNLTIIVIIIFIYLLLTFFPYLFLGFGR